MYAIDNEIAELQRQIDALAKRVLELTKRLDELPQEKQLLEGISNDELRLMALELNVSGMRVTLDLIERRMERWDEVYYHVFPERGAQDAKFEQQLMNLRFPPKAGDDKKQS